MPKFLLVMFALITALFTIRGTIYFGLPGFVGGIISGIMLVICFYPILTGGVPGLFSLVWLVACFFGFVIFMAVWFVATKPAGLDDIETDKYIETCFPSLVLNSIGHNKAVDAYRYDDKVNRDKVPYANLEWLYHRFIPVGGNPWPLLFTLFGIIFVGGIIVGFAKQNE